MAWTLSPALSRLRGEINELWPNRDRTSDGTIGDAAHSARLSDHNPDADGSVNAIDVDKDGIDAWALVRCAKGDRRCNYVIYSGTIWRRATGWRAETYTGSNGHYQHVHVSILHGDTYEDDTSAWGLTATVAGVVRVPAIPAAPAVPRPTPPPRTATVEENDMKDILTALYLTNLGRLPDAVGFAVYVPEVAAGRLSWADVDARLQQSVESQAFAKLGSEDARNAARMAAGWSPV